MVSIIGALLALLAYYMVSTERWTPTGAPYNTTNLISCLVLGSVALSTGTAGYILLNSVWGILAVKHLLTKKMDVSVA